MRLSITILFQLFIIFCFGQNIQTQQTEVNGVGVAVRSSSELRGKVAGYYYAKNLFDNNPSTAWVEGNKNDGVGEWIEFEFEKAVLINSFTIFNGYHKSLALYEANNRISTFQLVLDEKISTYHSNYSIGRESDIQIYQVVKKIRLQILTVIKGTKYNDLCISEIKFDISNDKTVDQLIKQTSVKKETIADIKHLSNNITCLLTKSDSVRVHILNSNNQTLSTVTLRDNRNDGCVYFQKEMLVKEEFAYFSPVVINSQKWNTALYVCFINKQKPYLSVSHFKYSDNGDDGSIVYGVEIKDFNGDGFADVYFNGECFNWCDDESDFNEEVIFYDTKEGKLIKK